MMYGSAESGRRELRRQMVKDMVVNVAGWPYFCAEIGLQSWGLKKVVMGRREIMSFCLRRVEGIYVG